MALDLAGLIQAAQLGKSLNPEVMQQQALGNQLALQLQQLKIQEAQQAVNDQLNPENAINRQLMAQLANTTAFNPEAGFNYTQTPGQPVLAPLTEQEVAQNDMRKIAEEQAGIPFVSVPQKVLQEPIFGLGGKALPFTRNLNARNKALPFDLSQGQQRFAYNSNTGKYDIIAENAPKGEKQVPLKFEQIGNTMFGFDPFTGQKVSETVVPPGSESKVTKNGLFIGNPDDPSSYKLVPGTGPAAEGGPNEQFQMDALDRSITAIDDLILRANDSTTGRTARIQGSKIFPEALQTDAYVNYGADLDSLKSQVFLTQISAMKQDSKTGAAGLGPVSNKEGQRLEDAYASLRQNQSPDNVKKNLRIAKEAISNYREAKRKFGSGASQATPTASTVPPSGKIIVTAPNGVQGYWDASKPLPAGYTK